MDENITKQGAADGDPDSNDSDVEIIESAKDETIYIDDNEPIKVAPSNDAPLVTIRFRSDVLYQKLHKSIAMAVTAALKEHLSNQQVSVVPGPDGLSLEVNEMDNPVMDESTDSLFVIDSTPMKDRKKNGPIPSYKKSITKVFDGQTPKVSESRTTKRPRAKQTCWNCEGEHGLKDCKEPRNYTRIRQKKEEFQKKGDRYHADLEQRYGHFQPGHISARLRDALGLGPRDLPLHVYRMRIFGYPPGWLEEAKITHSGLQLFGSNGDAVAHSEDDEGEVDNLRQKYDVRKIIEYPGFNEPPAPELFDDSKYFNVPPYTEELSRDSMMRRLEGTLVGGYRRKRLKLANDSELEECVDRTANTETVDMDAMECSPMSPELMGPPERSRQPYQPDRVKDLEDGELSSDASEGNEPVKVSSSSNDDLQASVILVETPVEVISLDDTPVIMPEPYAPASPSITELEEKQKQLVDQLSGNSFATDDNSFLNDILLAEKLAETDGNDQSMAESTTSEPSQMEPPPPPSLLPSPPPPPQVNPPPIIESAPSERPPEPDSFDLDELAMNKVPYIDEPASAGLKRMSLGTPILRAFTPYSTLPSGDAFSKGVSDVIHFENLPDSTGKYEQMKSLLSQVRLRMNDHLRETEECGNTLRNTKIP